MKKSSIIIITLLLSVSMSFSYHIYSENNRWLHSNMPVQYKINTAGAPEDAISAIESAFDNWQATAYSWITFDYDGTTPWTRADDNANILSWGYALGAVAATFHYDLEPITENDVVFESTLNWSTTIPPGNNCFDLENVAMHEIGH